MWCITYHVSLCGVSHMWSDLFLQNKSHLMVVSDLFNVFLNGLLTIWGGILDLSSSGTLTYISLFVSDFVSDLVMLAL